MTAILGGLLAAVLWATATVCSSRSSRMIGASSVLAWVMVVGLVLAGPLALAQLPSARFRDGDLAWWVTSGLGNLVGLLLEYRALRVGKVGIVSPIASTEGAIAAIIAVAAGESISPGAGATLAAIAVGIALAALAPDEPVREGEQPHTVEGTVLATCAAVMFGVSIYASGHLAQRLPVGLVVIPARIAGLLLLALPLAAVRRLRMTRRALPFVLASGVCEIGGLGVFSFAARHGVAVASVLGAQFAAFAALGAFLFFRERLSRWQLVGLVVIAGGVAALSLLRG